METALILRQGSLTRLGIDRMASMLNTAVGGNSSKKTGTPVIINIRWVLCGWRTGLCRCAECYGDDLFGSDGVNRIGTSLLCAFYIKQFSKRASHRLLFTRRVGLRGEIKKKKYCWVGLCWNSISQYKIQSAYSRESGRSGTVLWFLRLLHLSLMRFTTCAVNTLEKEEPLFSSAACAGWNVYNRTDTAGSHFGWNRFINEDNPPNLICYLY